MTDHATTRLTRVRRQRLWILEDAGEVVSVHTSETAALDALEARLFACRCWSHDDQTVCADATEVFPIDIELP